EGDYFRQPATEGLLRQKNAILQDSLHDPLQKIGVDGPAIRRLLTKHDRALVQRWIRITDAAMHEKPRGFPGFRVSPAAFLIDGIQNSRMPPDWIYAHDKQRAREHWEQQRAAMAAEEQSLRAAYAAERAAALRVYLASPEGRQH